MVHRPSSTLAPDRVDRYLEQGWFRFGGTMRTTRYTVWEEKKLRSTLWLRTNLQGYRYSRSNRRLLNRVKRTFEVRHTAVCFDAEHESLYAAYIVHVGGDRPPSLVDFLGGVEALDNYDTREISIWDEGELVAFSYFDIGHTSVMSLLGVFAPLRAKDSLGYATMLLEIDHALSQGMAFHYSGYVLPGEPRMDYKHRVGGIEFRDADEGTWHPWSTFDPDELPAARMIRQLDAAGRALGARRLLSRRMLNPLFELANTASLAEQMVEQPLVLLVGDTTPLHLVTWDDPNRCFVIDKGVPAYVRHRRGADGPEHTSPTAIVHQRLGTCEHAEDVPDLLTGL